jgi:hypothetical protein
MRTTVALPIDDDWLLTCVVHVGAARAVVVERLEITPQHGLPAKGILTELLRRAPLGEIRRRGLLRVDEAAVDVPAPSSRAPRRGRPQELTRGHYKRILTRAVQIQRDGVKDYAHIIASERGAKRSTVRSWIRRARKMFALEAGLRDEGLRLTDQLAVRLVDAAPPPRRRRSARRSAHR